MSKKWPQQTIPSLKETRTSTNKSFKSVLLWKVYFYLFLLIEYFPFLAKLMSSSREIMLYRSFSSPKVKKGIQNANLSNGP